MIEPLCIDAGNFVIRPGYISIDDYLGGHIYIIQKNKIVRGVYTWSNEEFIMVEKDVFYI